MRKYRGKHFIKKLLGVIGFVLLFNTQLAAQVYADWGVPYIKNYTISDYGTDKQIWDSTHQAGEVFFASSSGLIRFDGYRWETYDNRVDNNVFSVLQSGGVIYSAGYGNFGFWSKNEYGIYTYEFLLQDYNEPIQSFWRIKEDQKNIYFQSAQNIYIVDKETKEKSILKAPVYFNFLSESKGEFYIADKEKGLFTVKNKTLHAVKGAEGLSAIISVIKQDEKLIIATENDGILALNNEIIRPLNTTTNQHFINNSIFSVKELPDGNFYVGTIRNGVYLVSKTGEILFHTNQEKGIGNNTILSISVDVNNNIWLGADSGISYLETHKPVRYLLGSNEGFGSVSSSFQNGNNLLIGTNQGLFKKEKNTDKEAVLIEGSQGQVWGITKVENRILVAHHKGTFIYEDEKLIPLSKNYGTWIFKKHPIQNQLLYVGTYSGIEIFEKTENGWVFKKKWEEISTSSRFIEFDKYYNLWISHPTKGYYRLKLSEDGLSIKSKNFYNPENSNIELNAYLSKLDGDVVFFTPKGAFNFNPIINQFQESDYYNQLFDNKELSFIKQYDDLFWYVAGKNIGFVKRDENKFTRVTKYFTDLSEENKDDFTKISKLSNHRYGISTNKGLAIFNNASSDNNSTIIKPPIIYSMEFISSKDTIRGLIKSTQELKIPYKNNYIRGLYSNQNIGSEQPLKIAYKLEGWIDKWFISTNYLEIEFPSLSPGDYTLKSKIVGQNGVQSEEMSYSFKIVHPWYSNPISFIIYFVLISLIILGIRKHNIKKIIREQSKLRKIEEEKIVREKEQLEIENLEAEKELLILKEEKLSAEIEMKNNELAGATMNGIRRNKILNELKDELSKTLKENNPEKQRLIVKDTLKKINKEMHKKEDWLSFEFHFNNTHHKFFDRLRERYPTLTSNDIKLCAYIKLNLSSKEIASLMNISIKSVEMNRYRLRKKMDLNKEDNLNQVIGLF